MSFEWGSALVDDMKAPSQASIAIGPFGSRMKSDCYVAQGVKVVRGTNISSGRTFSGDFVFVTSEKAQELGGANLRPNDLVFPHRGSIGEVGIVPDDGEQYVISSSLMKLTCDPLKAFPLFIYYFFKSENGRYELLKNASQVGTPGIGQPLASLKSISVPLPPLNEQKNIAAFLGALDDRITLLRETNVTLEAIAQALFKSWFVDFDPVRVKAEGLEPQAMDAPTAALFPDSFEESELGLVPKGWSYVSLKEVTSIFDSQRVPLAGQERAKRKGTYPYYGAAALMDWVDDYLFDGIYLLTGEDGSVADPLGYPITQYVWGRLWVNNHAHVLQGKNGVSTEHLMLSLKQTNITPFITGAVQAKLSQSNMWRINFLMPSTEVAMVFGELLKPLYASLRHNTEQAQTLTQLRDTLLPRLISGQLRLPEAEQAVEEALA